MNLCDRWWKRAVAVITFPVWFPVALLAAFLMLVAFAVWYIVGKPVWWVCTGEWIEPELNNWTRKIP
jgi:hypothetical protein